MRLTQKPLHLRIPHPRWPSKDYRDYQTVGWLTGRRLRRSATATCVCCPRRAELPGLISVVGIHREHALLHVALRAPHGTLDRRLRVRLPGGSGETSNDAKLQALPEPVVPSTWTATLTLN